MPQGYAFISSPYSSGLRPEQTVTEARRTAALAHRYRLVGEFTAWAFGQGHFVFSPIVHCHEIAQRFTLPKDAKFWQGYNEAMLWSASKMWVLDVDGWDRSEGVLMERIVAKEMGIEVQLVTWQNATMLKDRYIFEPLHG